MQRAKPELATGHNPIGRSKGAKVLWSDIIIGLNAIVVKVLRQSINSRQYDLDLFFLVLHGLLLEAHHC